MTCGSKPRADFAPQEPPMTVAARTRRIKSTSATPLALASTITPLPLRGDSRRIESRQRAQAFLRRAAVVEQGLERRPLRAALSGSPPRSAHKPNAAQLDLVAELHALLGLISDPLAAHIVRTRLQILPGARRPQLSFKRIAADLGISARHAKRVYAKALDQIALQSPSFGRESPYRTLARAGICLALVSRPSAVSLPCRPVGLALLGCAASPAARSPQCSTQTQQRDAWKGPEMVARSSSAPSSKSSQMFSRRKTCAVRG